VDAQETLDEAERLEEDVHGGESLEDDESSE
jgi:hypothetical protein